MNQMDSRRAVQSKPSIYMAFTVSCNNACMLCLIYRGLHFWMLLSPQLLSLLFPSLHLTRSFLSPSPFLAPSPSLWPIFCLIAPISFTSHCPNSESLHFNLRECLVGMMYSLSWFAAKHTHQPVHQNRVAGREMLKFTAKKERDMAVRKTSLRWRAGESVCVCVCSTLCKLQCLENRRCPNYSAPLQALSRPPGVSPLEPPARVSLQRCRSLTLPPNTLTALALLLPQSGINEFVYLHE